MVVQVNIIHKSQLFPSSYFLHCRLCIWMALLFFHHYFSFCVFCCINRKTDHAALVYLCFNPGVFLLCQTTNHRLHYISTQSSFQFICTQEKLLFYYSTSLLLQSLLWGKKNLQDIWNKESQQMADSTRYDAQITHCHK